MMQAALPGAKNMSEAVLAMRTMMKQSRGNRKSMKNNPLVQAGMMPGGGAGGFAASNKVNDDIQSAMNKLLGSSGSKKK